MNGRIGPTTGTVALGLVDKTRRSVPYTMIRTERRNHGLTTKLVHVSMTTALSKAGVAFCTLFLWLVLDGDFWTPEASQNTGWVGLEEQMGCRPRSRLAVVSRLEAEKCSVSRPARVPVPVRE